MNDSLVVRVYKRTIIYSLVFLLVSSFFLKDFKSFFLGYLFGVLISMLTFKLLEISIRKSVRLDPQRAKRYASSQYFIRMIIYAVVLIIAAKADYLDFLATVIGILMIKIVIITSSIFNKDL